MIYAVKFRIFVPQIPYIVHFYKIRSHSMNAEFWPKSGRMWCFDPFQQSLVSTQLNNKKSSCRYDSQPYCLTAD